MTTIAFTADLHVDEYGSRVDPQTGLSARLLDYLQTTTHVALEARKAAAQALVVAGDLTERRHPAPWLVARIQEALTQGPDRLIVSRGNHDGAKGARWIGDVLARQEGIEAVDRPRVIPVADGAIAAMGYLDRHAARALPGFEVVGDAELFRMLADQFLTIARGLYAEAHRDGAKWVVLVCHQTLAGAAMSDAQRAFLGDLQLVVDARALADVGFEAVVAGHLHRHQVVVPGTHDGIVSGPMISGPVLYAGSIERVDFGEEGEPKGWILADVGPGRFDWEFVETPARRFVTLRGAEAETAGDVQGAIVRWVDAPPEADVEGVCRYLEAEGAFEVASISRARVDAPAAAGGISEALGPAEALDAYFADDPEREALVERGREILAEVA